MPLWNSQTNSYQQTSSSTPGTLNTAGFYNQPNVPNQSQAAGIRGADGRSYAGQVQGNELVENRLGNMLNRGDSAYLQNARQRGLQQAARRGLGNSSIAAGASERSAIESAMPIAQADAQTYFQTRMQNQGDLNANLMQERDISNRMLEAENARQMQAHQSNLARASAAAAREMQLQMQRENLAFEGEQQGLTRQQQEMMSRLGYDQSRGLAEQGFGFDIGRMGAGYQFDLGRAQQGFGFDQQLSDQGYRQDLGRAEQGFGFDQRMSDQAFNQNAWLAEQGYGFDLGRAEQGYGFDLGRMDRGFEQDLARAEQGYGFDLGRMDRGYEQDLGRAEQGYGFDLGRAAQGFGFDQSLSNQGYRQDLGRAEQGYGFDLGRMGYQFDMTDRNASRDWQRTVARDNNTFGNERYNRLLDYEVGQLQSNSGFIQALIASDPSIDPQSLSGINDFMRGIDTRYLDSLFQRYGIGGGG